MTGVGAGERGVVSGLLNLSRNLGLITGASLMGGVFAVASAGSSGDAILAARGMQVTFQTATVLALVALGRAVFSWRTVAKRQQQA